MSGWNLGGKRAAASKGDSSMLGSNARPQRPRKGNSKEQKQHAFDSDEVLKLAPLLTKVSLANSQAIRDHQAALMDSWTR